MSLYKSSGFLLATLLSLSIADKLSAQVDEGTLLHNPIITHKFTADPSALVWNDTVYIYASHDSDDAESGYSIKSIACISSKDLVNWTDHGDVFSATTDPSLPKAEQIFNTFAPVVVARKSPGSATESFYLYFGNGTGSIRVAKSDSPTSGFVDAIKKALINGNTEGTQGVEWLFDPAVFIDSGDDSTTPVKEKAYLYFGGGNTNSARVIALNDDMISVEGSARKINLPEFFEASWVHKANNLYYLSYATTPASAINYVVSKSLFFPDPAPRNLNVRTVMDNPPFNNNDNHHHSIFSFRGVNYFAYHNRKAAQDQGLNDNFRRSVCLDRLTYGTRDSMSATSTQEGVKAVAKLNPYARIEAETIGAQNGIKTVFANDINGNLAVSDIDNGDFVKLFDVDFSDGVRRFVARVASEFPGRIDILVDGGGVAGIRKIGECPIPSTVPANGGPAAWERIAVDLNNANRITGIHNVILRFVCPQPARSKFMKLNWYRFIPTTATAAVGEIAN